MNDSDRDTLQIHLDRLGQWTVENAMEIYLLKVKAVNFTRAQVKDYLNYFCGDKIIPEASSCKYLGIILRSDLICADEFNCIVQRAWKALHFIMHVLKKGKSNTKSLA